VPRARLSGAVLLLPYSLHGVDRDNFTLQSREITEEIRGLTDAGSNLERKSIDGLTVFSRSLHAKRSWFLQIGHDRFLCNPVIFTQN
jgi:hypothetical protein